jgi:hypothetical protein
MLFLAVQTARKLKCVSYTFAHKYQHTDKLSTQEMLNRLRLVRPAINFGLYAPV